MKNICILSKYPPLEGGVSTTAYWFAKALGERGHKIHIVTNSSEVREEDRENITDNEKNLLEPLNVKVHYLDYNFTSPILDSRYYTDRLAGLALNVIKNYNIDIIYSFYLLPYGVAGLIAKFVTGKIFIVRNSGSDIGRLYRNENLKPLFKEVLKKVDYIHGAVGIYEVLDELGIDHRKVIKFGHGTVYPSFNPNAEPYDFKASANKTRGRSTIFTFIGKIQKIKGADKFLEALSIIKDDNFTVVFISGKGQAVAKMRSVVKDKGMAEKFIFLDFQPPWMIPSIFTASDCVVLPENSEAPVLPEGIHYPMIGREAMACGKCIIMGAGIAKRGYYKKLIQGVHVLIIDPSNTKDFAEKLRLVIKHPEQREEIGRNAHELSLEIEDPARYYDKASDFLNSL